MHKQPEHSSADDILQSLQGLKRATAPPFLYTRVLGKLSAPTATVWDRLVLLLSKPAVALALAALLLLINGAATWLRSNEPAADTATAAAPVNETEYYSSTATLYDY